MSMDGGVVPAIAPPATATAGLPAAVAQWVKFLSKVERARLDPDVFAAYVPILASRHSLPPSLVADLLLRPTKTNRIAIDPRVPQYLQVLQKLRLVDTPSVLRALHKYSSSQAQSSAQNGEGKGGIGGKQAQSKGGQKQLQQKQKAQQQPQRPTVRWQSSHATEEAIFYHYTKSMGQGVAIRNAREAIETVRIIARWMVLFTDAAAAFSRDAFGAIHNLQAKEGMENARQGFVMLVAGVCENQVVLAALEKPGMKGEICSRIVFGLAWDGRLADLNCGPADVRKQLAESLERFIPTAAQSTAGMVDRLHVFLTQKLASFEPENKKGDSVGMDMASFMDNLIGLENFQVPEIPVINSRAGLYVYVNAAVGSGLTVLRWQILTYSSLWAGR